MAKTFQVRLKRSIIGATKNQKDAVRCLGLKKINSVVTIVDSPQMRGQIVKVQHLIDVVVRAE